MPSRTLRHLSCGLALVAVACGGSERPQAGGNNRSTATGGRATSLTGAGATFPNPIYTKWFDTYAKQTGVRINYQSIGSGGGIRQFTQGTVDFGASDGPMTDEQIAAVKGNVVHIPTVIGSVVVTYNLPSLQNLKLRLDSAAITDIYLGRLTKWNDPRLSRLNPGVKLPARDIIVVHRSDGSGTTYVFVDYLSKVSPEWRKKVGKATSVNWPVGLGGKGNEGVTQQVKQTEGAVGYVELIYAISNKLPYAIVKNPAGNYVDATLETATAAAAGIDLPPDTDFRISITNVPGANAYPIASFTWLLIRKEGQEAAKSKAIWDFVEWMTGSEAQRIATDLHYSPLPIPVIELVRARVPKT